MPQSLSQVIIHVVFSTKYRTRWLHKPLRQRLFPYMAGTVRDLEGSECYRVNGVEDHVHLAIRIGRTITIAKLVEKIKTSSSKWIKLEDENLKDFAWQKGYFAGSIGLRHLDNLLGYIDRQEEHHRKTGFQDEYRGLLIENEVGFDERYVWD